MTDVSDAPFLARVLLPRPLLAWLAKAGGTGAAPHPGARQGVHPGANTGKSELARRRTLARALSEGSRDLLDFLLPQDYEVTPDWLCVNGKYLRTFELYHWSRRITPGWLGDLFSQDVELDVAIHYEQLDAQEMMDIYQVKLGDHVTAANVAAKDGFVADQDRGTAIDDIAFVNRQLHLGETELFTTSLLVTVKADSLAKLGHWDAEQKRWTGDCRKVEYVLQQGGGRLVLAKHRQADGHLGTMPLGLDTSARHRTIPSRGLAYSALVCVPSVSMDHGPEYGRDLGNSLPVQHEVFDPTMTNANTAMIAVSGEGKSYLLKLVELRRLLEPIQVEGLGQVWPEVIVIDPENEQRRLCAGLPDAAVFVNLNLGGAFKFNPFDLPGEAAEDDDEGRDIVADHIGTTLIPLYNIMLAESEHRPLTGRQQTTLARHSRRLYLELEAAGRTPTLDHLYDALVQAGQDGDGVAAELAERLEMYVGQGAYAGLFAGETTVALDKRLIVFGIRDIPDEPANLRAIAIHLITSYTWARCRQSKRPRFFLVDEAGSVIVLGGAFFKKVATRARKYWLAPAFIFQTVSQAVLSPFGKEILSNCATVVLKRQGTEVALNDAVAFWKLDAAHRRFLSTCRREEALLITPQGAAELHVLACPEEHRLCTSAPAEVAVLEAEERATRAPRPALERRPVRAKLPSPVTTALSRRRRPVADPPEA